MQNKKLYATIRNTADEILSIQWKLEALQNCESEQCSVNIREEKGSNGVSVYINNEECPGLAQLIREKSLTILNAKLKELKANLTKLITATTDN